MASSYASGTAPRLATYLCIHVHMHINAHTYTCAYMYTFFDIHACWRQLDIYVCIHTHTRTHARTHTFFDNLRMLRRRLHDSAYNPCVYIHICIYMHTYTYRRMFLYIYACSGGGSTTLSFPVRLIYSSCVMLSLRASSTSCQCSSNL